MMTTSRLMSLFVMIGATATALFAWPQRAEAGGRGRVGVAIDIGRPAVVPISRIIVEPAVYETRVQRVWVEPVYRTEIVDVSVPALYETRTRRVWVPAVTEVRRMPVTVPAVYEERTTEIRRHGKKSVVKERVLVRPETTVLKEQTVVVRPGYWREIVEKVLVRPAGSRREERRVLVESGHWTTVSQRICVRPEQRRTVIEEVPATRGGFYLGIGVDRGHRHGVNVQVGVSR